MANLSDVNKTDYVNHVLAADINAVIASTVRGAYGRSLSISDTLTLTDIDYPSQYLTPTGAHRNVLLPLEAATNHLFIIKNASATYNLVVKNSTGATTVVTILPGEVRSLVPTEAGAAWDVLPGGSGASTASSGWTAVSDTWTYASATTITVPAGAPTYYEMGDKISLTQGGTTKYFYVVSVSNELLTINGGSSYTLTDAAISNIRYSKAMSPVGFPAWFSYAPTGIAASNVTLSGRFCLLGLQCVTIVEADFTGGITFTTMPTLPITCYTPIAIIGGPGYYLDSGTAENFNGLFWAIVNSSNLLTLYTAAGDEISASVPITWANGDKFICMASYSIGG